MELEFDKEIDVLLRKARSGTAAAAPAGGHLDADAINAFAEGAVPAVLRKTYTAHLADCDRCRNALSRVALLNEPIAMKAVAAAAAAPRGAAPWPPNAVPWYRGLFRSPGFAAAFGVLVLAFAGVLVYIAVKPRQTSDNLAMQPPGASSVPYSGVETNSTANSAAISDTANAISANAASNAARSEASPANNASAATQPANSSAGKGAGAGGVGRSEPTSSGFASVQPPAVSAPAPIAGAMAEKPKTEDRRDEKETGRNRALSDDSLARGETAAKRAAPGGPMRAGPVQNQMQMNTQSAEMAVTRKAGGKTFHNSNGAWYDNAYHGQSTTNVRRGTDEFKKLDSGLRAIANELGGVVVVVWKDKAFRIQ
jgi:hypothetical protein